MNCHINEVFSFEQKFAYISCCTYNLQKLIIKITFFSLANKKNPLKNVYISYVNLAIHELHKE
jgi:hypothetical protein